MVMKEANKEINRLHYERLYDNYSIDNIIYWVKNLDSFLNVATSTETSWFGLYQNNFRRQLKGRVILEMGCGDCTNAAIMAALGAKVYANDIASASGDIVKRLNESCDFEHPIIFVEGDFLDNELPAQSFDFVIGKAFLHHLTLPLEELFLRESARLLKTEGEARFFEPAVNSKILDFIRWCVPVKGRPSKLDKSAFKIWKENDPHPDRSFSSKHWEKAGLEFFKEVHIVPIGILERFSQLLKWGKNREEFRRKALRGERVLPNWIRRKYARSQLIIYRQPLVIE